MSKEEFLEKLLEELQEAKTSKNYEQHTKTAENVVMGVTVFLVFSFGVFLVNFVFWVLDQLPPDSILQILRFFIPIPYLFIGGGFSIYVHCHVHEIIDYITNLPDTIVRVISGKKNFAIEDKQKAIPKLRCHYEQSDEQFILTHRHYRFVGILVFYLFALFYSPIVGWALMSPVEIYSFIFFVLLAIPISVSFACFYLCSCRESWTLDVNGLTRNFSSMLFSSTTHISLYDLRSFQFIEFVQYGKRAPEREPFVVAESLDNKTTIYSCKWREVSVAECRYLADTMQKVLLKLQNDRGIKIT
jgi:hypothetical protein